MINIELISQIIPFVVIISMAIVFQVSRNTNLKIRVLNWGTVIWLLIISLYFYNDSGDLLLSIIIGIIFGLLIIPLTRIRKTWLAFCKYCGRTVHFSFGDPVCPYCKKRELI